MNDKKYIGIGIISLFLLFILSGMASAQTTVVSVSPSTQNVAKGETFTIDITIDPGVSIAGAQFDLSFNPSLVSANSVTEGNLLDQGGASTYFSFGTIDNTAGTITGVAGAITTPGQTVSSPGVFATIQMTAKSIDGTSPLDLSNVIFGDINGNPVSITVNDGTVTVGVSPTPQPGTTTVSISPSAQSVTGGSAFTVTVIIDSSASIAGAQFDLSFNPSLVSANTVTEGNLLNQGGASTYFSSGSIDNTAGTITGVAGAITTPGQTVSSPGIFATIQMTAKSIDGTSPLDLSNVIVGDINGNPVSITVNDGTVTVGEVGCFDIGSGTYPSISGTHTGTIIPSQDIYVSKIYTYPSIGTGGHSEYVRIWGNSVDAIGTWEGYNGGDWNNITFDLPFTLEAGKTYNYIICTGSYPQIIHKQTLTTLDGSFINCTVFTDVNGRTYDSGIPAIRLWAG